MKTSKGIVITAFGKEYERLAAHACFVSRRFTDLPFFVLTNIKNVDSQWTKIPNVYFKHCNISDDDNRHIKTSLYEHTPFEHTLYIDADAVICKPGINFIFTYLEQDDVVLVEGLKENNHSAFFTKWYEPLISKYNIKLTSVPSGCVVLFKKTKTSEVFFHYWNTIWKEEGKKRDMPCLYAAYHKTKKQFEHTIKLLDEKKSKVILNVNNKTGTCFDNNKESFIQHRFGQNEATWFSLYQIPQYKKNKKWDK